VLAVTVTGLYLARQVLMPLALAILLSFVLAPLVLLLRRIHVGRVPSVFVAVLMSVVVMGGIGALIAGQVAQLAENLPQYQGTITQKIRSVRGTAASSRFVERTSSLVNNLSKELSLPARGGKGAGTLARLPFSGTPAQKPTPVEIVQTPPAPLETLERLISPVLGPLAMLGIVIVFLFFILLQREDLRDRLIRLAGARDLHRTTLAIDDAARRLSRYFLMQSAVNAAFGVLIGTGLFVIGVPNPVLWGVLATLLRFIPYIGAPIAAIGPAVLAMAVGPGWSMLLWTVALFLVVEPVIGQLIEPLLYGHSTGVSAVAVILSAVFWTWLWGPVGLLLSMPLTVCLVVLGRHVERLQFLDVLFGNQPALAPEESFYQRMLAGDPDEAAHQAEAFLKDKPLAAYYDEIVIRGLVLAQLDTRRGVLDRERRASIKQVIEGLIDDLSEHDDSASASTSADSTAPGVGSPEMMHAASVLEQAAEVLCVSGRGSLDEAAAAMLAQLLRRQAVAARVVSNAEASAANIQRLDLQGVRCVCLSYLDADGLASARYLVRRLRRRLPRAKLILGLWSQAEAVDASSVLKASEADGLATSLVQAVAQITDELRPPAKAALEDSRVRPASDAIPASGAA
jgi:predicted PurR-regulated permease PerM